MAVQHIRTSDASGEQIPRNTGARIRVVFNDPHRTDMRADLTDEEVERLLPWAVPVERRPERGRSATRHAERM